MKQFEVRFVVVVDVDDEIPEDIYSAALDLIGQGIGGFDYDEVDKWLFQ